MDLAGVVWMSNKTIVTKQKGDVKITLEIDPENGINEHTWRYLMSQFVEVLKGAGYCSSEFEEYADVNDEPW